ncbi:MAG: hypothetical protein QOJ19_1429 [Acidimicrobiia bacterium]|jgi:hypothetical protein|nr:hypothetical protein [Acidimicrobiia bacterium]
MDAEKGERIALVVLGALITAIGLLFFKLTFLPLVVRGVLSVAPLAVGLACIWTATLGWEEVGSGRRKENPEELLSVERLFLVPLAALALTGLVAILVAPGLMPVVRIVLGLSTAVTLAVVGGLTVGRIRIPSRQLGRQESTRRPPRPPQPPRP